jgi:hypothetical protein
MARLAYVIWSVKIVDLNQEYFVMSDSCCCPPEAGNATCDLPVTDLPVQAKTSARACPTCGKKGKAVEGQTVKAMLKVSLRAVTAQEYFFCRTEACPIVYFSSDGTQTFTANQVRETVYQKDPQNPGSPVCYCFAHSVDEIQSASPDAQKDILKDINSGIKAGQCACDLRNPQGSCCLGNVQALIKTRLLQES